MAFRVPSHRADIVTEPGWRSEQINDGLPGHAESQTEGQGAAIGTEVGRRLAIEPDVVQDARSFRIVPESDLQEIRILECQLDSKLGVACEAAVGIQEGRRFVHDRKRGEQALEVQFRPEEPECRNEIDIVAQAFCPAAR